MFLFFLAKELGMTVSRLCCDLTQEELIGWAAFYELKAEQEEKTMDNARTSKAARTMGRR
jgi:hypothetical protein